MPISGIDLSSVQGALGPTQWRAIAQRGTRFAVAKCATGNDGKDPSFDPNIANARGAGLTVGAYFFAYPLPTDASHPGRDPEDQAQLHFEAADGIGTRAGDLPPCVDLEWPAPQDWSRWGVTAASIRAWVATYLAKVAALWGRTPIVYSYPDFARAVSFGPELARCPLWAAEYDALQPMAPWAGYSLLQTAGGSSTAISRRFQQCDTLPDGVPVDTDIIADESTLAILLGN